MVMVVGIIGFAATLGFIVMWHDSLRSIVLSMLSASILTLSATGTYVLVNLKRGRRYAKQNNIDRYTNI